MLHAQSADVFSSGDPSKAHASGFVQFAKPPDAYILQANLVPIRSRHSVALAAEVINLAKDEDETVTSTKRVQCPHCSAVVVVNAVAWETLVYCQVYDKRFQVPKNRTK